MAFASRLLQTITISWVEISCHARRTLSASMHLSCLLSHSAGAVGATRQASFTAWSRQKCQSKCLLLTRTCRWRYTLWSPCQRSWKKWQSRWCKTRLWASTGGSIKTGWGSLSRRMRAWLRSSSTTFLAPNPDVPHTSTSQKAWPSIAGSTSNRKICSSFSRKRLSVAAQQSI